MDYLLKLVSSNTIHPLVKSEVINCRLLTPSNTVRDHLLWPQPMDAVNLNKKLAQAREAALLCDQLGKTFLELIPNRPMKDASEWYIDKAKRLDTAESAREIDRELASIYASLKQGRGGPMDGYAMNEDGSVDTVLSRYYRDLIEELQGITRNAWLKGVFLGRN